MNERIKQLRKNLDLTLDDFGSKLGVTKATVSRWEKGERNISEQTIKLICSEFSVNEIWLRTGEGGDDNMFAKVSEDDRFSLNLGKLGRTDNEFIINGVNYLAETDPEKLKIVEEFMKTWLGIK